MQVNDAHDIDVVMRIYNLIENINNYSKMSGILWQCCRDEPAIKVGNNDFVGFNAANVTTNSFKIKQKITGLIGDNDIENVEIMVPLKYLNNFWWRILEMYLINCEINLDLN